MPYPHLSPLQLARDTRGGWTVPGAPNIHTIETLPDAPFRDWLTELGLPKFREQLEALAKPQHGLSPRCVRFVLADESPTCLPNARPLRPSQWGYDDRGQLFTLSHTGLVIGVCEWILPGSNEPDAAPYQRAPEAVGQFLVGEARFYDSLLASVIWTDLTRCAVTHGMQAPIFTHVCPVIVRPDGAPRDAGVLVEVALTDAPACPGAQILHVWDDTAELAI